MNRSTHALMLATCMALAACGGGGDDSPGAAPTPVPAPSPTPASRTADVNNISIAESQSAAANAVATVNAAVADVAAAADAPASPLGALTLPLGATLSGTINCNSGNVNYVYEYDAASSRPISYAFTYNNCRYGTASAYSQFNGTVSLNYSSWTNSANYTLTQRYDLAYQYVSPLYNTSGTINGSTTCTSTASVVTCSYNVGANGVTNASVSRSGTVTTVTRATVRSGTITVTYSNWAYDSATGRATSGTVTATDGNGNSVTIEIVGNGYRVTVVKDGRTTVYTVAYNA